MKNEIMLINWFRVCLLKHFGNYIDAAERSWEIKRHSYQENYEGRKFWMELYPTYLENMRMRYIQGYIDGWRGKDEQVNSELQGDYALIFTSPYLEGYNAGVHTITTGKIV